MYSLWEKRILLTLATAEMMRLGFSEGCMAVHRNAVMEWGMDPVVSDAVQILDGV